MPMRLMVDVKPVFDDVYLSVVMAHIIRAKTPIMDTDSMDTPHVFSSVEQRTHNPLLNIHVRFRLS